MDQNFVKVSMASAVPHLQEINDALSKEGADPKHLLNHLGAVQSITSTVSTHIAQDVKPAAPAPKPEPTLASLVTPVVADLKKAEPAVSTVVHTISPAVYYIAGGLAALGLLFAIAHHAGLF